MCKATLYTINFFTKIFNISIIAPLYNDQGLLPHTLHSAYIANALLFLIAWYTGGLMLKMNEFICGCRVCKIKIIFVQPTVRNYIPN